MALNDALLRDLKFENGDLVRDDGDLATVDGIENVRQALLRRLLTMPGSLIHRPQYGVGIGQFQGSLQSFATQQQLALRIQEQFAREDRVESVDRVVVSVNDEQPDMTRVLVTVKIVGYGDRVLEFIPFGGTP